MRPTSPLSPLCAKMESRLWLIELRTRLRAKKENVLEGLRLLVKQRFELHGTLSNSLFAIAPHNR